MSKTIFQVWLKNDSPIVRIQPIGETDRSDVRVFASLGET